MLFVAVGMLVVFALMAAVWLFAYKRTKRDR